VCLAGSDLRADKHADSVSDNETTPPRGRQPASICDLVLRSAAGLLEDIFILFLQQQHHHRDLALDFDLSLSG
jgi:hypothetical protein